MKPHEWKELARIACNGNLNPPRGRGAELLAKTRKEQEHPEDYEGPCDCWTCRSYG